MKSVIPQSLPVAPVPACGGAPSSKEIRNLCASCTPGFSLASGDWPFCDSPWVLAFWPAAAFHAASPWPFVCALGGRLDGLSGNLESGSQSVFVGQPSACPAANKYHRLQSVLLGHPSACPAANKYHRLQSVLLGHPSACPAGEARHLRAGAANPYHKHASVLVGPGLQACRRTSVRRFTGRQTRGSSR